MAQYENIDVGRLYANRESVSEQVSYLSAAFAGSVLMNSDRFIRRRHSAAPYILLEASKPTIDESTSEFRRWDLCQLTFPLSEEETSFCFRFEEDKSPLAVPRYLRRLHSRTITLLEDGQVHDTQNLQGGPILSPLASIDRASAQLTSLTEVNAIYRSAEQHITHDELGGLMSIGAAMLNLSTG